MSTEEQRLKDIIEGMNRDADSIREALHLSEKTIKSKQDQLSELENLHYKAEQAFLTGWRKR